MTQLEDDEMLTKGQTFEKKTLMRSKETKQCSEAESEETKHGESYRRTPVEATAAKSLIPKTGVSANNSGSPGLP